MELDLRGTEAETLIDYLTLLGGTVEAPDRVVGPNWSASLTVGTYTFGHWQMPRVIIRFAGDPDTLTEVVRRFRMMAWRGGG